MKYNAKAIEHLRKTIETIKIYNPKTIENLRKAIEAIEIKCVTPNRKPTTQSGSMASHQVQFSSVPK